MFVPYIHPESTVLISSPEFESIFKSVMKMTEAQAIALGKAYGSACPGNNRLRVLLPEMLKLLKFRIKEIVTAEFYEKVNSPWYKAKVWLQTIAIIGADLSMTPQQKMDSILTDEFLKRQVRIFSD